MKPRMISRTVAAATVVVVSSAGTVALGTSAAQAADSTRTVNVSLQTGDLTLEYGSTLNLLAATRHAGKAPGADRNPIELQRRIVGGQWKTIRRADSGEFWQVKAWANATYRVHYLGGTSTKADGSTITWQPGWSRVVRAKVRHRINWKTWSQGTRAGITGTVSPQVRYRATLQTATASGWRTVRKITLTKGRRFKVALDGANGQKFRLLVPGTRKVDPAKVQVTLTTQWTA